MLTVGDRRVMKVRALAGLLLAGLTALGAGCSISPADREATLAAWAERDRVYSAECARRGGRYLDSTCLQGGGP